MNKFPVGIHRFGQLVGKEAQFVWIDRSLYMKYVVLQGTTLILRPRRSGKTMFLNMIYDFLSPPKSRKHKFRELLDKMLSWLRKGDRDSAAFHSWQLYKRLKSLESSADTLSLQEKEELSELRSVWALQGQTPVLFISFASPDCGKKPITDLETVEETVKSVVSETAFQFRTMLLTSQNLNSDEKEQFKRLLEKGNINWQGSLKLLCKFLCLHFEKEIVLLIDEYDGLINTVDPDSVTADAYRFVQLLWAKTCKDNVYVQACVMTGITRYLFNGAMSGTNNVTISDVLSPGCLAPVFGFREEEVIELLKENPGTRLEIGDLRKQYNGYRIGAERLYNPWSVMSALRSKSIDNYWSATGSVWSFVQQVKSDSHLLSKVQKLYYFSEIEEYQPSVPRSILGTVLTNLCKEDFFWYTLLQAGYLTLAPSAGLRETEWFNLRIPNQEMKESFASFLSDVSSRDFVKEQCKHLAQFSASARLDDLLLAFENILVSVSLKNLTCEQSYHNLLFGLLFNSLSEWMVLSEVEAGDGILDLCLVPRGDQDHCFIIELKHAKTKKQLENQAELALRQIDDRNYQMLFLKREYSHVRTIVKVGLAFHSKDLAYKCTEQPPLKRRLISQS
uniref:AAA-ATPase-like domain-containing protein n=1 Tax=Palpitomonas bilix TaxID=652834 RepID=A0A7S3D7R7_9EUKA|mmetsp:Transcript_25974/g.65921  ORF Transcript_25974/g.65921 Transcript_25974/m.65921 type:complete len:618 (+) Transcript_25974:68-1921(+)